jgi:hypothetical protein
MLQRQAVEELHDNKGMLFGLPDLVDGADIGMIQCRGGSRLPPKPLQSLVISRNFLGQKLQSDKPPKLGIFGLIDHTHPAAAELLNDPVVRDGLPDHWAEMLGLEIGQVNEVACSNPSAGIRPEKTWLKRSN